MSWLFETDTVEPFAWMDNALSSDECEKIKEYALKQQKIKGRINGELNEYIRKSEIVWLNFYDPELRWIFEKLTNVSKTLNSLYFKFDLYGFCELFQFAEYKAPDGFFDIHTDKIFNKKIRKLSLVIQLTDSSEYEGGELQLFNGVNAIPMKKNKGTVIAFPSYTLHKVTPVTKGIRHTLVVWITGPNFK